MGIIGGIKMGGGYVETPLIYLTKHLCTSMQQDAE